MRNEWVNMFRLIDVGWWMLGFSPRASADTARFVGSFSVPPAAYGCSEYPETAPRNETDYERPAPACMCSRISVPNTN